MHVFYSLIMKSMKTRIVMTIIALAVAGTTFAANPLGNMLSRSAIQNPQYQRMTPEERAKAETQRMKTDLTLTDQQLAKVDTINLKYAKMRSGMRGQFQGDREGMMAKMQEMQQQKNAELKSVLTEEQMKKYEELLQQRRGFRGQGRGPQGGGSF